MGSLRDGDLTDMFERHFHHTGILEKNLGFGAVVKYPLSKTLACSVIGSSVPHELNAASLKEFCYMDLFALPPDTKQRPEPHQAVRQMSLATLLQPNARLETIHKPDSEPPWWELLECHEREYYETQTRKDKIVKLAKSIVTTEESKTKFLRAYEDAQRSKKKKKKQSKTKDGVSPTETSRAVSPLKSTEASVNRPNSKDSNTEDNEQPNQLPSIRKRSQDSNSDGQALAATWVGFESATYLNETPKWQSSILPREEQNLRRTVLITTQPHQRLPSIDAKKDQGDETRNTHVKTASQHDLDYRIVEANTEKNVETEDGQLLQRLGSASADVVPGVCETTDAATSHGEDDVMFVKVEYNRKPPKPETTQNIPSNQRSAKHWQRNKRNLNIRRNKSKNPDVNQQEEKTVLPSEAISPQTSKDFEYEDAYQASGSADHRKSNAWGLDLVSNRHEASLSQQRFEESELDSTAFPPLPSIRSQEFRLAHQPHDATSNPQSIVCGPKTEKSLTDKTSSPSQGRSSPKGSWHSVGRMLDSELNTQTRAATTEGHLASDFVHDASLHVSFPQVPSEIPSPHMVSPLHPLSDYPASNLTNPPSDDGSDSDYDYVKYYVPKDPAQVRGRRDTIPSPIPEGLRARSTRAETLPAYELGGRRQPLIHHTHEGYIRRSEYENLPYPQSLQDMTFQCSYNLCRRPVLHLQPGAVQCHFCGWASRTRYCCNLHRLFDSEQHHFRCGIQDIISPMERIPDSPDRHFYFAPVTNILGFANAKRTRQLINMMHNPNGQYTLFLDSNMARLYGVASPLHLCWEKEPADPRKPSARLIRGLLGICFENHMLESVVRLTYIFVRLKLGQLFFPEAPGMIEQLDAQFALEFAYDVPSGWPWGLHPILWRGCGPIWECFRPQLETQPVEYAFRLSALGRGLNGAQNP